MPSWYLLTGRSHLQMVLFSRNTHHNLGTLLSEKGPLTGDRDVDFGGLSAHCGGMRLLHTSDWHIGKSLHGRSRYDEFQLFLEWLLGTLQEQKIDVLLVAGDLFDTGTPSNRAQRLYYSFLSRVNLTGCSQVVCVGGNHDSPSFLDAPAQILQGANIRVIGGARPEVAQEVLLLKNHAGIPLCVLIATPYIRERDLSPIRPGESMGDRERKHQEQIRQRYAEATEIAQALIARHGGDLPLIATGHLFLEQGMASQSERPLYVGNVGALSPDLFPPAIDYVALGHLHAPQAHSPRIQYSGSPLPLSFGEAKNRNRVLLYDSDTDGVTPLLVPRFKALQRLSFNTPHDLETLVKALDSTTPLFLEVTYTGSAPVDLIPLVETALSAHPLATVLSYINQQRSHHIDRGLHSTDELDLLDTPLKVFDRCLEERSVPPEEHKELRDLFTLLLQRYHEVDWKAW